MRSPESEERGHVTLDVVDPKEVLASLRNADVATTLRLPTMSDVGDDDVTLRGRRDELEELNDVRESAPRLPRLERTALDAALEAAARATKLEDLEDLEDDSPTLRGARPLELEGFPEEVPTVPAAAMVREALLAATKAALAEDHFGARREAQRSVRPAPEPSAPYVLEEAEEDRTLRADRRALTIAMQGDRAAPEIACSTGTANATNDASSSATSSITSASAASSSAMSSITPSSAKSTRATSTSAASSSAMSSSAASTSAASSTSAIALKPRLIPAPVQPPALPVPLVRRVDAWIDELPEAARRVLLDARDAQPSWPIVERTEGAVLVPKQRIPSLRPRQ